MRKIKRGLINVLLLLLAACMLFTGCGEKSKAMFTRGFGYNFESGTLMLAVSSNSDTFDVNNVTLDLHIGIYNSKKNTPDEAKRVYFQTKDDDNVFFGLYIRGEEYFYDEFFVIDGDFTNIEPYHLIRMISGEEGFSGEYGFTTGYVKGIVFDHNEPITIPAEIFNKTQGSFQILIMSFVEPANMSGKCKSTSANALELDYQIFDDGIVKLN